MISNKVMKRRQWLDKTSECVDVDLPAVLFFWLLKTFIFCHLGEGYRDLSGCDGLYRKGSHRLINLNNWLLGSGAT